MYSRIAVGNVKKSFKDYTIYFLTLTLAVAIFYAFNSIGAQKATLEINANQLSYIEIISESISMISVFVSIILGGLIIYANNFLIKKRKKELGIYMTLGMGKKKISKILIIETFIVGIISLISGLIVGLMLSQGLSIFTSKLFEVSMSEYKFILSLEAIQKTVVYFGIMFVLVMLFNTVIISKYKIIELLTAGRKNESIRVKNPVIYLITFIICVISLGAAYKFVLDMGLEFGSIYFKSSIVLGILGTFLFFFSLAGFLLYVVKKSDKVYLKGLNIFITKQINSKVNTNFISMSIICLMLVITMGVLSTGLSIKNALEAGLEKTTPFDASGIMYLDQHTSLKGIEEALSKLGFTMNEEDKYVYFNDYRLEEFKLIDLVNRNLSDQYKKDIEKFKNVNVYLMKISDYNNIRELRGKDKIELMENEAILTSSQNKIIDVVNNYIENNETIEVEGKVYKINNEQVITDDNITYSLSINIFTVVVPDEAVKGLEPSTSYMNVNYSENNREESEEKFKDLNLYYRSSEVDYDKVGFIDIITRHMVYVDSKGITTTVLFIGIYLGIVFLITSMAVLALQQLSEASDSVDRYKSLRRIGATEKMINKSIFTQTFIYFSLPVILAFIHSVVGISVVNDFIAMFNKPDIGASSIITVGIFLIVYIGYFYATYTGYKNIIKKS